MQIDKSDFIAFLTEFGSTVLTEGSSFKGFFVPLQSSKQLLDVKLEPGDAVVVYTDPAESLTLGELLTFGGKSFVLVSNSKIQYINGNPIYLELGLARFLPALSLQSEYQIRTSLALLLNSLYNIAEGIYSLAVSASYDIPTPVAASRLVSSAYDIAGNLFAVAIASSYDIAEHRFGLVIASAYDLAAPVAATQLLSSAYKITEQRFALLVPASYDILAPAAISGLRAEFYAPPLSIVLHWNAHDPSEVDHYEVHRSTTPSFTPSAATLVGRPATNSVRNRDLLEDVIYYFKVCTVDRKGNKGSFSTEISTTTSGS